MREKFFGKIFKKAVTFSSSDRLIDMRKGKPQAEGLRFFVFYGLMIR